MNLLVAILIIEGLNMGNLWIVIAICVWACSHAYRSHREQRLLNTILSRLNVALRFTKNEGKHDRDVH